MGGCAGGVEGAATAIVVVVGWPGVVVTVCPMKVPLDTDDEMASDIPVDAASASARERVKIVAVTSMDPAAIASEISPALTLAAAARAAM